MLNPIEDMNESVGNTVVDKPEGKTLQRGNAVMKNQLKKYRRRRKENTERVKKRALQMIIVFLLMKTRTLL